MHTVPRSHGDQCPFPTDRSALCASQVRWFCFTDEDADSAEGTVRTTRSTARPRYPGPSATDSPARCASQVRNYAKHGPPCLTVGSDEKPRWSTRAEIGESDEERVGAARAVPRQLNRLLALALDENAAPYLPRARTLIF